MCYFFPVGRVFLSHIQLKQALRHFLVGWNIKSTSHGCSVVCFYSDKPTEKKYESKCEPCNQRQTPLSLKLQYKCPFQIKYSLIGYHQQKKLPTLYYRVIITGCNYEHTCQLSNIFYNVAQQKSRGIVKFELKNMNAILIFLKSSPSTNAIARRTLLLEYINDEQVKLYSTSEDGYVACWNLNI